MASFRDSFWGWSTSACLCFPCGLIALSRDPKQTREEFKFDVIISIHLFHQFIL